MQVISRTQPSSTLERLRALAVGICLGPPRRLLSTQEADALTVAIRGIPTGKLAEVPLMGFTLGLGGAGVQLLDVLAEILASKKIAHDHGKIVIGKRLPAVGLMTTRNGPGGTCCRFTSGGLEPMAFPTWDCVPGSSGSIGGPAGGVQTRGDWGVS